MQSSQTIHLYLKENTKPLHDQTEFVMKSREMMDLSYTVEEYIRFLQIQLRFHQVLETVLLAHPRISGHEQLDWPRRRRSHLAMQDLEMLEANPTLDSIIHFPDKCEAEVWGMLYVAEGSTLGGNVILKALKKNPNFEHVSAWKFLGYYGGETGTKWREFLAILDAEYHHLGSKDDFLAGANDAFTWLMNLSAQTQRSKSED
ncbi:MAG: biliverdin-producing heme oxygenase [Bacteroidota bacterium]